MKEDDLLFSLSSLFLSPVIPLVMMVAGLISENVDKYATSAKGCPTVHSSQSNTATTRGYSNKSRSGRKVYIVKVKIMMHTCILKYTYLSRVKDHIINLIITMNNGCIIIKY